MDSLWIALGLGNRACVALVGAGGKTTTMLALAKQAVARRLTVAVTTTTKIWPPGDMPLVLTTDVEDTVSAVRMCLLDSPHVAIGTRLLDSGKLAGLEPQVACRLVESGVVDVVLCEADGAAGRSLKLHGDHEPVVPTCSTLVVVVGGLDALGQPAGLETIHRFERYAGTSQADLHAVIDAGTFARILLLAAGKQASDTPVAFILNKADGPDGLRSAREVAQEIRARAPHSRVVATSHAGFMDSTTALTPAGIDEQGAHLAS